jgi:hypothetical protein
MSDPAALVSLAAAGLAGMGIVSAAALKGWSGWLALKRLELAGGSSSNPSPPSAAARIELADLKERVRKLEAIAAGIDI